MGVCTTISGWLKFAFSSMNNNFSVPCVETFLCAYCLAKIAVKQYPNIASGDAKASRLVGRQRMCRWLWRVAAALVVSVCTSLCVQSECTCVHACRAGECLGILNGL